MNKPDNKFSQLLARVLSKSSRSWLAPIAVVLLGIGIVAAIWMDKRTTAIAFVSIITLIVAVYVVYAIKVEQNQLSQSASLSDLDELDYITLDSTLFWTIENEKGSVARLEKIKIIRSLKSIDVIKEFWWGDGKPPLDQDYTFKPPAKEIGRSFREGSKRVIFVILDRLFQPGEIIELSYTRKLYDAFTSDSEWVETFVASETEKLNLSVVFPNNRLYKTARAISRLGETSKEYPLTDDKGVGLLINSFADDGRVMLTWSIEKPELGRTYTIEWDW